MSLGTALTDDHPLECGCVRALTKTGGCLLNHPPNEGRLRARNGADCIERIWYGPSGQHASPRPAGSGGVAGTHGRGSPRRGLTRVSPTLRVMGMVPVSKMPRPGSLALVDFSASYTVPVEHPVAPNFG